LTKTTLTEASPTPTLKKLARLSLAYGTADVLPRVVDLALLPLYTTFLTPSDYGALALLLLLSTFLKILFRLGLDSGFLRIHYDLKDEASQKRFAGTTALFSACFASAGFLVFWFLSPSVSFALFESSELTLWVRLVAFDLLASSFTFVPLSLLRIEEKASLFSTYSLLRHGANVVFKVAFVVMGLGVTGVLVSDAIGSVFLALCLLAELRPRAILAFDWPPLREALRFGLPKVPHGLLAQTLSLFDRRILAAFVPRSEVGIYAMGGNFASAMKFPLSAFEPAWQPFVFDQARKEGGAREIGKVATRMAIVFVVLALVFSLTLPDLLRLVIRNPEFHRAASVVPTLILATLFQGFFFLSSVGISIAKEARYYPIITASAVALNIGLDLWLIPSYGILAAAWATVAGYALMAVMGAAFSRRLFPIPIEAPRIAATLLAALAWFALGASLGPHLWWVVARGLLAIGFCLFAWRLAFDDRDRDELRKVFGL
jgi:O-antigen/teichoic acid export membrane protein